MSQDQNNSGNPSPDSEINLDAEENLPEQIAVRLAKRERLNEIGEAYPVSLPITHTIDGVRKSYPSLEVDTATGDKVALAGRIVFQRNTGKLCFATLQAGSGERIQAMLSLDKVGEERLELWKELVDLGDHVFISGEVISSKRGELSVLADEWLMAAKTIRPLPNMHNELGEEYRVRHRYVDLIVRDRAREVVQIRAKVMQSLRRTFEEEAFLEVETPMLQTIHGGASARPFKTHSNAFDTELFLRIAPELFLKRAVVGGIDRVFEINRNFRNEGADRTHSPEFAMLEAYQAYADYNT
ncbi:MAG: lysine--tRNA ligase, partial [Actinobacteria bacterium]|nr:lysine--tRNA ligase [Actinomycetota bacterium]